VDDNEHRRSSARRPIAPSQSFRITPGGNQSGEVGDGTTEVRMRPVTVATLSEVVEIAAGSQHFCARTKAAKVWCWGFGAYGTLGDGSVNERKRPTSVTF
jgi:alpha-tubulin suppressor-like RCC1 family protein